MLILLEYCLFWSSVNANYWCEKFRTNMQYTWETCKIRTEFWLGNLKEENCMTDRDAGRRIILIWIFYQNNVGRCGSDSGSSGYEHWQESDNWRWIAQLAGNFMTGWATVGLSRRAVLCSGTLVRVVQHRRCHEDDNACPLQLYVRYSKRLRWSRDSLLAFGTQVRGFFRAKKSSARLPSEGK